jgi:hypothetical protein
MLTLPAGCGWGEPTSGLKTGRCSPRPFFLPLTCRGAPWQPGRRQQGGGGSRGAAAGRRQQGGGSRAAAAAGRRQQGGGSRAAAAAGRRQQGGGGSRGAAAAGGRRQQGGGSSRGAAAAGGRRQQGSTGSSCSRCFGHTPSRQQYCNINKMHVPSGEVAVCKTTPAQRALGARSFTLTLKCFPSSKGNEAFLLICLVLTHR